MKEIEGWLDGWSPDLETYHLYEIWKSDHTLPYSGGWLDQPRAVHRLFNNCALWDEYLLLNASLPVAVKGQTFDNS